MKVILWIVAAIAAIWIISKNVMTGNGSSSPNLSALFGFGAASPDQNVLATTTPSSISTFPGPASGAAVTPTFHAPVATQPKVAQGVPGVAYLPVSTYRPPAPSTIAPRIGVNGALPYTL